MPNKLSQDARQQILGEYKIFHEHTSHEAPQHELLFRNILVLSRRTVHQYSHDVCPDFNGKPWIQHNINRAKAITERVERCLEQRRNEPGWRLHLENWVFSRFEVEVVCPECRARLWRSELEAAVANSQQSLDLLQKRRSARKPCRCQKHRDSLERYDDGLNDLFESREEDGIVHEEEIMCKIQKEKEKPDRVWGLRTTKRIERTLSRQRPAGIGTVGETVATSLFTGDASTLLYPFLLLETKSAKSADTFSDIDKQTGFNVRTLLRLQYEFSLSLADDQRVSTQNSDIPLVWVISSKGEHWRVSAAYMIDRTSGMEYHILHLWDGRLTHTDEALRLVLILDYIFDWARDVYRGAIVDSLSSLVQSPTNSLRSDTDVISTREFQKDLIDFRHWAPKAETGGPPKPESSDTLRFYDKSGLALRDSSYMSHRVVGLYLTVETLDNFLHSVSKNDEEKFALAKSLLHIICASKAWSVTVDCLSKLEGVWTGFDRESVHFGSFQELFLAFFSVKSHFGTGAVKFTSRTKYDDWLQVHTLSFIAISPDALHDLQKMLGYPESFQHLDVSEFSADEIIDVFDRIRHAPVRQCLAATIETRQVFGSYASVDNQGGRSESNTPIDVTPSRRPVLVQTLLPEEKSGGELPERVYRQLKTGMREPKEDFLRVSSFEGERTHENSGCTYWPGGDLEIGSRQLAVHVSWPQIQRRIGALDRVSHCVFLLPHSMHQSNAAGSESCDSTLSTNVLKMKAEAVLLSNQPCTEGLCVKSYIDALKVLYQVAGCYFEHVNNRPRATWQGLFVGFLPICECESGEHLPRIDFPPEDDREYCLDILRYAGAKFGLEKKLLTLIETFSNARRFYDSSPRPNPRPELVKYSQFRVCPCSLRPWHNVLSLPDRPRVLPSILSNASGQLQQGGIASYRFPNDILRPESTSESTESEMNDENLDDNGWTDYDASSDGEVSTDSYEDDQMSEDLDVTLQADEPVGFEAAGPRAQMAIVRSPADPTRPQVSLPPPENFIVAWNHMGQHQQLPTIQNVMYAFVSPTPRVWPQLAPSPNRTPNLPLSMPSRRIGINDILNN